MNINGLNLQVYRIQGVWAVFWTEWAMENGGGKENYKSFTGFPKALG
jgi:hypothetical protein